jgi:hypothetical protein
MLIDGRTGFFSCLHPVFIFSVISIDAIHMQLVQCWRNDDAIDAMMTQFILTYKMLLPLFVHLGLLIFYQLTPSSLLLLFLWIPHSKSDSRYL